MAFPGSLSLSGFPTNSLPLSVLKPLVDAKPHVCCSAFHSQRLGFDSSGGEFSALLSGNVVVSIFSSLRKFWGLQRMETKFARPKISDFFYFPSRIISI